MRACPLYGGMTMFEQKQTLAEGVEIIVGTPGRIIDMIKKEYTNCFHVTYLILDEADRMFSLGFGNSKSFRAKRGRALFVARELDWEKKKWIKKKGVRASLA